MTEGTEAGSATKTGDGEPPPRPNLLCLVMDQLRWDHLGCYDNQVVRTPNLDRLAARGVVFDRAYVANPLCMPARATLFTGRTPRGHGVRTNGIPLSPNIPTMTEALRQAGYHTHLAGKLHLSNFQLGGIAAAEEMKLSSWPESRQAWEDGVATGLPSPYYGLESADFMGGHGSGIFGAYANWLQAEHPEMLPKLRGQEKLEDWSEKCGESGFKSALPEELHYNRYLANETCRFLEEKAGDQRSFFCWTSFPDPHHPYAAHRPYCDWYDPRDMPLPSRQEGELERLPPFYKIMYEEGAAERWRTLSGRGLPTKKTDDQLRHIWALTYAMVSSVDAAIGRILDKLEETGLAENTVVCFLADHGDMLGDHFMMNKGPFHFEALLRMPFIWSWPGHFPEGARTPGLASQIDFAPTVLDLCGVDIPEGPIPSEPESPRQRLPWPGKSLTPVLAGQEKKVRDWVIVENDEDYLGANVRTFITNRYKITVYSGHEDWGELFDLKEDPNEFNNLWDEPEAKNLKTALLAKFMHCYLEEDSVLPRRLTHA